MHRLVHSLQRRLRQRSDVQQILRSGQARYWTDPRFNLEAVEQGLISRLAEPVDDSVLLERICNAWAKATKQQATAEEAFQPHSWWRAIQQASLGPVTRALAERDFESLRQMYRNFFRDPCSAGLCGLPTVRIGKDRISKTAKKLQLIDGLHRIDLWKRETEGRFHLGRLQTPEVGNPFGLVLGNIFVRSGSEDQHYYAQKIISLLGSADNRVVAEIGGGFGGMAYFLLRDQPAVTYVDFDLPETIALASYYLLSAFPDVPATLYGEAQLNQNTLRNSRIILMPGFAIGELPAGSVDVSFNSRILSDLPRRGLDRYLAEIARTTRGHLLHLNRKEGSLATDEWLAKNAPDFRLAGRRRSEWNDGRTIRPNELENLYERAASERSPYVLDRLPS